MFATRSRLLALVLCHVVGTSVLAADDWLEKYNVVWGSPSKDCNGSMPIGNGEMGLNVWVEPSGDLVFLCGRTDSWDETMTLCKVGRVRIKFMPSLTTGEFKQTLRLRQGEIEIHGGPADSPIKVRVWPDALHQVVRIEADSPKEFQMQVGLEVWRKNDMVLSDKKGRIAWCHRNMASSWKDTLELQRLQPAIEIGKDPLLHRTFGGLIQGKGLVRIDDKTLKTATPGKRFCVTMSTHTLASAMEAEWLAAIENSASAAESVDIEQARAAHRRWWDQFWKRSWIRVSGTPEAEAVTRGYVLQRFITAGGGRGHFPIKFNGSIFTVDGVYKGIAYGPDFRLWAGCYWFHNTQLVYWPMLASGDFEMMRPLFRMYEDALPLARLRSKIYFGHGGCFFPETITFWGTYDNGKYGWCERKDGKPGDPILNDCVNDCIRYHYNGTLALLAIMLDYYDYTQDKDFLAKELLPVADEFLVWWDKHWSRDAAGKLKMFPSNALESICGVTNPAQDVAGLQWNLDRLLAFSDEEIGEARHSRWSELRKAVPALPTTTRGNTKVLIQAELPLPKKSHNADSAQLYSIFPFRIYGVGKPDLQLARDTFDARTVKGKFGWSPDDTQAAMLGLAAFARECVADRAQNKNKESRFPAFWGPDFDWTPSQNHGGNLLIAMQAMLVQADAGRIRLLPAWPKDWDVDFKLRAPQNTIVEGAVRGGKLLDLKVSPEHRKKDLVVLESQ